MGAADQNGRRKEVNNYGGAGPQELWEIETLVDGMLLTRGGIRSGREPCIRQRPDGWFGIRGGRTGEVRELYRRGISMRAFFLCFMAVLSFALVSPMPGRAATTAEIPPGFLLSKIFSNPPDSAKPQTWWHWMNGNVTEAGITADLEAMKRVGLGGAEIFTVDCGHSGGSGSTTTRTRPCCRPICLGR